MLKKSVPIGLLVCLSFLNGCGSPSAVPLIVRSQGPYVIGDRGPTGGWIIHDKGNEADGWRYLEAAPEDQTPLSWRHQGLMPWGCNGKTIPGARHTTIGTGMRNTSAILRECEEPDTAARMCANYRGGDKDDWFLPSLDELNAIYRHLHKHDLGGFGLGEYWSSSETSKGYAWYYNFTNGKQLYCNKWPKHRVRCVRAFSETPDAPLQPIPVSAIPPVPLTAPGPLPKGRVLE
jgi:hypothetical protein